ncbi:MAG: glycosyltransferase family 4 protein, partial [Acidocella sp.]|nr:glycosyltransferase family 4 protein [Acidocella sp.]
TARRYDLLWIEKEYLPWMPYWVERLAISGTPYVLDIDDAWTLRYETSRFSVVRRLLGDKFPRLVAGAALVFAANENLYRWALAAGAKRVVILPTVIDLGQYPATIPPDGVFTIGWIGTPITVKYLDEIANILRELAAEAPLTLLIIGAAGASIPGVPCESVAWTAETEALSIARCHVGIMPLPDDAWAAGKSGYKLIQYMAIGRPTMASAIGANNQIVIDGQTGFLAKTDEDWGRGLRRLRDDPALARTMGEAGRARVAGHYCLDVTAPVLVAGIKDSLGNIG